MKGKSPDSANRDDRPGRVQADQDKRVRHRRGYIELGIRHYSGEHCSHQDIEHRADQQADDDA